MVKKNPTVFIVLFLVLARFPFGPSDASAQMVVDLNLEQMTALSDQVFTGKCAKISKSTDSSWHSIQEVTFDVEEVLKGDPVPTVTFKQLVSGAKEIRGTQGERVVVQGLFHELPTYRVGEESIIFLSAADPGSGLTAPIGLAQGKFKVTNSSQGKLVVNGHNNKALFPSYSTQKNTLLQTLSLSSSESLLLDTTQGELPYTAFASMVKKLAEAQSN